jgi:hypothetical protein
MESFEDPVFGDLYRTFDQAAGWDAGDPRLDDFADALSTSAEWLQDDQDPALRSPSTVPSTTRSSPRSTPGPRAPRPPGEGCGAGRDGSCSRVPRTQPTPRLERPRFAGSSAAVPDGVRCA